MSRAEKRSAARLAAVQALYQMDVAGAGVADVLAEFESHWIGQEVEGVEYKPAEAEFFRDIVGGVVREQRELDPQVDQALSEGWPLKRVDAILRAILRAGAYELAERHGHPAARDDHRICRCRPRLPRPRRGRDGQCGARPPGAGGARRRDLTGGSVPRPSEDELIARYFAPLATLPGVGRPDATTRRSSRRRRATPSWSTVDALVDGRAFPARRPAGPRSPARRCA